MVSKNTQLLLQFVSRRRVTKGARRAGARRARRTGRDTQGGVRDVNGSHA